MALIRIASPGEEPVSLAEAKAHCRVDHADDDALISALIVAAREQAEHETGRAFVTQTWELVHDEFPDAFVLRKAPVQSVVSVRYLDDSNGTECELDPADYLLDKDGEPGYVVPNVGLGWPSAWPVPNAVRCRYVCGYGAAADVPQAVKQWILMAVGTLYAQRETLVAGNVSGLPDRFWQGLLDPFRLYEAG